MKWTAKACLGSLFVSVILLRASELFGAGLTVAPTAISNTYAGTVTLTITALTNTETVVIQKFVDGNTNGVIDGADMLCQQFRLTDGQASIFHDGAIAVTNFVVPGDTDGTAGQIKATLYPAFDLLQHLVGKYLFKLSSPTGRFVPVTNVFTVTNFPYAQTINGNVVNNGTNVPNAVVVVFQPSGQDLRTIAGTVANNSGAYAIKLPAGSYGLGAFKSNFVMNIPNVANLTLNPSATVVTNVIMSNATTTVTGKVVDSTNSSIGLPGLLVTADSSNFVTIATSDTNGNFTLRVRPSLWEMNVNGQSSVLGYLRGDSLHIDTSTGGVSGVMITLAKETAIFYGSVKDSLNKPLPGAEVYASSDGPYQDDGVQTATNGNYIAGALDGDWWVGISGDGNTTYSNYVFTSGTSTTLTNGQAFRHDFTALLGTNHITGHVQFSGGASVTNLSVNAYANIGGNDYQSQALTGTNGNYSLNVPNGDWNVSICCGCNDCGDECLPTFYQCPNSQPLTILNNNGVANFTISPNYTPPNLSAPVRISPSTFQFLLRGTAGMNYTIQVATNIDQFIYWSTVLVTNAPSDSFTVVDPTATNRTQRYYRALVGP